MDGLREALSAEAECGCGIECGCYSYLTLKNYDSATGAEFQVALAVIDGAVVTGTVADIKAAIDVAKNPA